MKAKIKETLILIMIFVFQLAFTAFAKDEVNQVSSNIDVVFLLDSSGSMKESDPEDIRIEAIKMFLDMAQVKGNKVGLVAYSENIVREHNLDSINSAGDKDRIKDMASNIAFGQKTDTGMGLSEAVKLMDSGHEKNHKPIIILLSDGKNDPQRKLEESTKDLNSALDTAKSKGYPVYTIGLNYDGTVDKAQLDQISNSTKGKNYITNTASNLPNILTDIYADNSKLKVQDGGTVTANGDFQEVKLNIPNSNVMEANVSMLSEKPVELKIFDPTGKEVAIPSNNAVLTSSKKYSMLKLIKPSEGDWTIKFKGVSGSSIKISYVFNYDLQIEANFNPKDPHKGDKINIEAYFTSNGQKISDKDLYKDMKAKLLVKSFKDNSVKEIPLSTSEGIFKGDYSLKDNEKYELKVRIDGNSFYRESSPKIVGTEGEKSSSKNNFKVGETSIFKKPVTIGIIAAGLLGIIALLVINFIKKKRVHGFGRVMLQVKDENSSEILPPQYRNLDGYVGSFNLFEVLGLREEYAETQQIKFIFRNDDCIELENRSQCTIHKSGRKLDDNKIVQLCHGNKITVFLNKTPKSIVVEFYAK